MKFSPLVERIGGEGAEAWTIHYAAREAQARGEDVIVLSIGDPELDAPAAAMARAMEALSGGDLRYTPAAGRSSLREAIAESHARRTGQAVNAENTIFLSGAQNALFTASLCVAGPGDEVLALQPLYPSYPATIRASGASLVRVPVSAAQGFRLDRNSLEAAITPRTRALFFATPNNPSGVILSSADLAAIGELARRLQGASGRHRQQNVAGGGAHTQGEAPRSRYALQGDAESLPAVPYFDMCDRLPRRSSFEQS